MHMRVDTTFSWDSYHEPRISSGIVKVITSKALRSPLWFC